MDALLAILRKEVKAQAITQADLGATFYRSQTWVSHHLDGSYVLSLDDYLRLCQGLQLSPVATLHRALYK